MSEADASVSVIPTSFAWLQLLRPTLANCNRPRQKSRLFEITRSYAESLESRGGAIESLAGPGENSTEDEADEGSKHMVDSRRVTLD